MNKAYDFLFLVERLLFAVIEISILAAASMACTVPFGFNFVFPRNLAVMTSLLGIAKSAAMAFALVVIVDILVPIFCSEK